MLIRMLVGLVDTCRRHALAVLFASILVAVFAGWFASVRLGVTTDTDLMFARDLPWRQKAVAMAKDFPQFQDLLVAVIDARTPEEADATAAELARVAAADTAHFRSVRRPDASPFFEKQGLLFLSESELTKLMDRTIDAQPFLGQLVVDPSARGLFAALSLLGMGVAKDQADLGPYLDSIRGFHGAMAEALAGTPKPLSWQNLLGGGLTEKAGPYRFVLLQPRLDHDTLEPGGAATRAVRDMAAKLEFVQSGAARVRLTGQVALADEEFATVAQGAVEGMIASTVIIAFLLFLAVRSWRLIVPILFTLGLGLLLTVFFAAAAIGRLNLISVGFGVLFLGLAVDFAIQFSVRFREQRHVTHGLAAAMTQTGATSGGQILVAALAVAAGFLAFAPTSFSGVAELGIIAGIGMLIAFVCTLTFLPAAITLCRPHGERGEIGFAWAAPLDPWVKRWRWPILTAFATLAVVGAIMSPRLSFDSDPLNTKNPDTQAMKTLRDLIQNPITNPYTIDIIAASASDAGRLEAPLKALPATASVVNINSFVPDDQPLKLALIADANTILAPTLATPPPAAPITTGQIRLAAMSALAQIEPALRKLPAAHPLADIAHDLRLIEKAPDDYLLALDKALTRFLPQQLTRLRVALTAEPINLAAIPPDIARDWLLPDGRARLRVAAKPEALATIGLAGFVAQVAPIAPNAAGSAVTIVSTSNTIIGAFRDAAIYALVAITLILGVALRRPFDVGLVLAPLLISALLTLLISILLPLPLNFANIVALPLLLGVGVSFNVYTVMNWRAGHTHPIGSATTKAIVYSALTTATAFGSLALSAHPGTASMGALLMISLACSLAASLVFLPALLSCLRLIRPHGTHRTDPHRP